jgi:hypothetical protein
LEAFTHENARAISGAKEKGHTFIELSPNELQQWADTMKPINDIWIKETEARGLPAKKAFDDLLTLFKKYQ